MANKLTARLKAGKACVNGWLAIPSGFSAEVMAQCGWDSITVDMQHGVQDYQSMVQCFQSMTAHPVTPLVRVPWNEPGIIGKALDGGAMGIICPMVNNKAEAAALASAWACAGVFTIGQMTPQAPPSSTLPMMPGSFHGTRTSGVIGYLSIAWKQVTIDW